ncbi:MAG: hypothetical protein ACI4DS_05545 [Eubacterium sp.]
MNQIMVHGANIRLSTMNISILSQNKVALMTLDDKYLPTVIVLPFEGHARQSIVDLVVHNNIGSNIQLTKAQRRELAYVLHNACIVDGAKINVM